MLKKSTAASKSDMWWMEPKLANGAREWLTVLVSVDKPPLDSLNQLNRSERHQLLCRNSQERYEEIIAWIAEQKLQSEFRRIGSPTLFSTITMVCTKLGASMLANAPGVTRVIAAPELVSNGH